MGNSLFDQLQKSGLVDEKKARKARHGQIKYKKHEKPKKGAPVPVDEAKLLAQKAHAEKVERDRQLNQRQKNEASRKAIAAQIRQLIENNAISDRDGDIAYNFSDANVVKRLHVSQRVHQSLVSGRLAIVRLGETYALVPRIVAEKIGERDEQAIVHLEHGVDAGLSQQGEDDPYADYQIPDDLMW